MIFKVQIRDEQNNLLTEYVINTETEDAQDLEDLNKELAWLESTYGEGGAE